jgi:putative flavoprotein involved in K+ transport
MTHFEPDRRNTVVIGGGQAGLAVGYHLQRHGTDFVILDANEHIGDAWRNRWDSLRLFTPAYEDSLDGLPFPAAGTHFPTKDEMADYLASYAEHFDLPVRLGTEVDRLSRNGETFMVAAGNRVIEADNVVVAMSGWQRDRILPLAEDLDPSITQIRSSTYQRPSQLPPGDVLVVGAANSGAEIALDIKRDPDTDRRVWLAGHHPGHVPFAIESWFGRHIGIRVVEFLFHHVMTRSNPLGRRFIGKVYGKGMPLVRTKPRDLVDAGVETIGRIEGTRDGRPTTDDGTAIDADVIVWACGYTPGFSWIDLDILDGGYPREHYGIAEEQAGLYFVGLPFLYAISSHTINGVSRDACRVADAVAARNRRSGADRDRTASSQVGR